MLSQWIIYMLVVVFGSSTWMGTNAVWMQLPQLTVHLPEGWNLPSYLTAIVQIGCIAPLIYGLMLKCCSKISLPTGILIMTSILLGASCELALVFLWKDTVEIGSENYSVALYCLMLGLSMVDALSNVLFLPFTARFHPSALNAYFVGMGFSALLPSLLSLAQGTSNFECVKSGNQTWPVYDEPHFSVSIFFLITFFWTLLAALCFFLLYRYGSHNKSQTSGTSTSESSESFSQNSTENDDVVPEKTETPEFQSIKGAKFVFILLATALINAQMNGIINSIQSYAALPYSQAVYHYGVTFSNVVAPLASFLPFFFLIRNIPLLAGMTAASSIVTAFIIYLATLSPNRIFDSETAGGALSITAVLVAAGLHNYLRIVFASLLREGTQSEDRLFWCGAFIQIGSFVGTAIMFPLVNVVKVFRDAPSCPN